MYYLASLLIGVFVAVMITANGGLTALYGVYSATVIIHIVGLILIRCDCPAAAGETLCQGATRGISISAACSAL